MAGVIKHLEPVNHPPLARWAHLGRFAGTGIGLIVFAWILYEAREGAIPANSIAVRVIYALWTVGMHLFFMVEYVWGVDWAQSSKPCFKERLDYWKGTQDRASKVWAALVVAGAILMLGKI